MTKQEYKAPRISPDIKNPTKTLNNSRGRILLEKDIENYGRKEAKKLGWSFEKFTSPQKRSVPDDICISEGLVFFIEFKRPKQIATASQQLDHIQRRKHGVMVFVVDCYEQFDIVARIVKAGISFNPDELPPFLLV